MAGIVKSIPKEMLPFYEDATLIVEEEKKISSTIISSTLQEALDEIFLLSIKAWNTPGEKERAKTILVRGLRSLSNYFSSPEKMFSLSKRIESHF